MAAPGPRKAGASRLLPFILLLVGTLLAACSDDPPSPDLSGRPLMEPGAIVLHGTAAVETDEPATFAALEARLRRIAVERMLEDILSSAELAVHRERLEQAFVGSADTYLTTEEVLTRHVEDDGRLSTLLRIHVARAALEHDLEAERETPAWLARELEQADQDLAAKRFDQAANGYERAFALALGADQKRAGEGYARALVRSLVSKLGDRPRGAGVVLDPVPPSPGAPLELVALLEHEVREAFLSAGATLLGTDKQPEATFVVGMSPTDRMVTIDVTDGPGKRALVEVVVRVLAR